MFSKLSKKSLLKAVLTKEQPIYVQFYITARCNLTCQQCNIIYANSDLPECTLDDVQKIADNFAKLGVAIVLLTGGEPFVRKDLPEIIYAFESRGVHVRMQTNGLVSEEQIIAAIEAGGKDISISLDTLIPESQDKINGDFVGSWYKAIKSVSIFTKYLPKQDSFASFGCVMQRDNLDQIENVIKFATGISWYTSLVPVHVTQNTHPLGFRTFNQSQKFLESEYFKIDKIIEKIRKMKKDGYLLYDSNQYLDDIKRFIRNPNNTTWRKKNKNVCDSPNLYFAVLPNGELAPCCDHRIENQLLCQSSNFVEEYKSKIFRVDVNELVSACTGCMYGSFPEITISARYLAAQLDRIPIFFTKPKEKKWPVSYEKMISLANKYKQESIDRVF